MNKLEALWNALTRKKPSDESEVTQLSRVLNLFDLTALGVGSTLGLGVYVLAGSVAYDQAGPAVVISFLIAAIASSFAALCYAEFAARVPRAGSAYVYSYVSVGEFIAFTIGWNLLLEYVIGASSVARGLSGYIDSLNDNRMEKFWTEHLPMNIDFLATFPDLLSFAIVAILSVILAAGVKESSWVHSIFTCINVLTVLIVLVAGSLKADPKNWEIQKENIPEEYRGGEGGFMPFGITGVMSGAAKCFYGFVGFDCVATAGEEAKDAKRTIPLAIILTLGICAVIYMGISTVLTMMWPYYLQDPDAPLPYVFEQIGWIEIKWLVSVGAVFALFASLLGALFSLPRILYAMSSDRVLFRFMSRVHPKTHTPIHATLLSGLLSASMAAFFSLHQLVDMLSIGTLLAYTIVAVCVLVLNYESNIPEDAKAESFTKKEILWKLLNLKHSEMSNITSNIAKCSLSVYSILSIILSCIITFFNFTIASISIISLTSFLMVLTIAIIYRQPYDKSTKVSFKVPFVPFLPMISIAFNFYLMLQLDVNTWIRFGAWLIVGYLIYFLYGIRKSTVRCINRQESFIEQNSRIIEQSSI